MGIQNNVVSLHPQTMNCMGKLELVIESDNVSIYSPKYDGETQTEFEKFLSDKCVANVAPEVMEEVSLNVDIANRIYDLLKKRKMTQREFATLMGKRESEISRWLTGSHGFTTTTLAKIAAVLGEPVIEVKKTPEVKYVFIPARGFITPSDSYDGNFNNQSRNYFSMTYIN